MKVLLWVILTVLNYSAYCQEDVEKLIRKLENEQREAILGGDSAIISNYMSPKVMVQNPDNKIIDYNQMFSRVSTGKIDYAEFRRNIEKISIINNIAVVMGNEVLQARGNTSNAGKKVTRRFTNIWMNEAGSWKITARQATIISIE